MLRVGIEDDMGADPLMLEALDKVEKNIGKPLLKDDANGMSIWKKELDQINQKWVFFFVHLWVSDILFSFCIFLCLSL